jgi:hypothetical protein
VSTSVYVARELGDNTTYLSSGATVGTIVGGDDALDTHDSDTSYILLARDGTLTGGTDFFEMPFVWERISGPAQSAATATSITVEGALRRDDTATPATAYNALFQLPVPGLTPFQFFVTSGEPDTYLSKTASVSTTRTPYFEDGSPWLITLGVPDTQFRMAYRITYLRAVIEGGESHLRQKNRDSIRARNRASRQRGIRARGYY